MTTLREMDWIKPEMDNIKEEPEIESAEHVLSLPLEAPKDNFNDFFDKLESIETKQVKDEHPIKIEIPESPETNKAKDDHQIKMETPERPEASFLNTAFLETSHVPSKYAPACSDRCHSSFSSVEDWIRQVECHRFMAKEIQDEMKKKFHCTLCNRNFSWKSSLEHHIAGLHFKRRDYPCWLCEKKYVYPEGRSRHLKTVHNFKK